MEKHAIEINISEISREVNAVLKDRFTAIVNNSIDTEKLKREVEKSFKGGTFESPGIVKIIESSCEWAFESAVREAIESSDFKDHLKKITNEILFNDEFSAKLKEKIQESIIKRV